MRGLLPPTLVAAALLGACAHAYDPAAFRVAFRNATQTSDPREAIQRLERTRAAFPEKRDATDLAIARIYAQLGQPERSLRVLQDAQDDGVFFGLLPQMDWLQQLQGQREFQAVLLQDLQLRAQADRESTMLYDVVTPVGYSPKQAYPLFIVLHAGGDDMANARRYWTSEGLGQFITVYVQSSRHLTSSSFTWLEGDLMSRAGLRRIYDKVVRRYRVDPRRVLIGGMSAGGMMSLDVVLHDALPVTGFVVNCPVIPGFGPDLLGDVRRRGIRGVILTGERDFSLAEQKALVEAATRAGVAIHFTVIPGLGHALPADFPARLDAALADLTEPPPPVQD